MKVANCGPEGRQWQPPADEFLTESEPEECSDSRSDSSGGAVQESFGGDIDKVRLPIAKRRRPSAAERKRPAMDNDLSPGPRPGAQSIARWALARCEKFGLLEPIMRVFGAGPMTIGSICSGMDVAKVVWDAVSDVVRDRCGTSNSPEIVHVFQCENDPHKASYLVDAHGVSYVFRDAEELASPGEAWDVRSQRYQKIPVVQVLSAGFSCKTISGLCNSPAGLHDLESTSGLTCNAVCEYISWAKPAVVFLENVKNMLANRQVDGGNRPIDLLDKRMDRSLCFVSGSESLAAAVIVSSDCSSGSSSGSVSGSGSGSRSGSGSGSGW